MNTKYILLSLLILTGFSSCKKWLDVKPKTQIESEVNFKDEQGFQDALTGAYLNMASQNLYGKELSYGMIEILAKNYTQLTTINPYTEDAIYNYTAVASRGRIDKIWNGNYNTIANLNNLIENIDKADKGLFTAPNYQVIKGEAYGLRAFNHFDLLRLFAPSPAAGGLTALAIPYRDQLTTGAVRQSTIAEVIAKIIADLQIASEMLKSSDPLVKGSTIPTTAGGYLRDRQFKLNYYAVRALMARVYLYSGDKVKALECAKEVIESGVFPATTVGVIIANNKILSTEVIFNLYLNTLATQYEESFSLSPSKGMNLSTTEWNTVYETTSGGSADYRYLYQTTEPNSYTRISVKFNPAVNLGAPNRLPLMRVSEMYYIAAECLAPTDPVTATGYLNTVRRNRNLLALPTTLTADQIQSEIFKEYRKEFFCEGQLFFYYKRMNLPKIEFTQVTANNAVYVLPKPDNEIEFGSFQ